MKTPACQLSYYIDTVCTYYLYYDVMRKMLFIFNQRISGTPTVFELLCTNAHTTSNNNNKIKCDLSYLYTHTYKW